MFDLDTWQEIISTIVKNKMRSLMTAFGVFWGIFMLVIMTGSGNGMGNGMSKGVMAFSSNSLFLFAEKTSVPFKGFQKGRSWSMDLTDIDMVRENIPGLKYISGMLWAGSSDNNIVYKDKYGTFSVRGFHSDYMKIDTQFMLYGRMINQIDIDNKRKVCVIGQKVYDNFFQKGQDPCGELIKVNGLYYRIIGVNEAATKNINIGGRPEEMVAIPITTLQQSTRAGTDIHGLAITMNDDIEITSVENDIKNLVRKRHQLSPEDEQALNGFNISKIFNSFLALFIGVNVLIWIVGTGTLLAGVVGVCNIMLVTIKERTNEIGLRRALGATPKQIVTQIMSETLVLTIVAGFVGLCSGVGLLSLFDMALTANASEDVFFVNPQISFGTAIAASAVLIFSGLLAGLLPSVRALQIKAIDALREE